MRKVEILREQSQIMRSLAASVDNARMKRLLIEMAAQCEEWALAREQALGAGQDPPAETWIAET